jgi:hypothetical protein
VAADLRGSGYPDIFIANDYGVSELFVNEGGRFREVGRQTGVGYAPKSGMNASVGDIFNAGRFAIYVSNISEEGILLQGNNLWVPTGNAGGLPRYENMARSLGVDLGGWSWGAQFGDLNNDGLLDIYLVNGYVSASRTESYWYDFSKVAGGHERVISDARHWPAMGDRSLAGYQPKKVWVNDGAGRFVDVAPMVGVTDRYDGRSVALADLGRGVLDVVVANQRGPAAAVSQRRPARPRLDRLLARGELHRRQRAAPLQQPQRDWRARHRALERPAAGAAGVGRIRASARRTSARCTSVSARTRGREGGDPLAVGSRGRDRRPEVNRVHAGEGSAMSTDVLMQRSREHPISLVSQIDRRYLAPVLVTLVLIGGQITFGFLESWSRTALAIGTAIVVELVLGRVYLGIWPHLASAYVSGISVGMLVRSPDFWPYAVCSALAITSKYLIRMDGRHIWNPSNFAIVAMLVLAADTVASLSVQWGNNLLPMVVVWSSGPRSSTASDASTSRSPTWCRSSRSPGCAPSGPGTRS